MPEKRNANTDEAALRRAAVKQLNLLYKTIMKHVRESDDLVLKDRILTALVDALLDVADEYAEDFVVTLP